MDETEFWSIIDEARSADRPMAEALEDSLAVLPRRAIRDFDAWFWAHFLALDRYDLVAAFYAVEGVCSDDLFDYFRRWLVGRGRDAVRRVVQDPEALADCGGGMGDEALLGAARAAYERAYREPMPDDRPRMHIPDLASWPADRLTYGTKLTEETIEELYPKLWARYVEPRRRERPPAPTGSIEHDRFWALIDEARAGRSIADANQTVERLIEALTAGPLEQVVGFGRWLYAYNQALIRNDLRALCRVILGTDDVEDFAGFRGWLIAQGRVMVEAAVRDADSIATVPCDPPVRCRRMIFADTEAGRRLGRELWASHDDVEPIPGVEAWREDDPPVGGGRYEPAMLRARLPRLTQARSDEFLTGPYYAGALSPDERSDRARRLFERVKRDLDAGRREPARAALDEVLRLTPRWSDAYRARAKLLAAAGEIEPALADLELALRHAPHEKEALFERAQVLLALGRTEEAIASAKEAQRHGHPAAPHWLTKHATVAPPKRVRHAKFGEGAVLAIEGTGDAQKLVVEFEAGRKTLLRRFLEILE